MEQRQHQGLSAEEVRKSREQHGANILTPQEKEPLWRQYLEKCEDPLIIVLIIAGVLSVGIAVYEFCSLEHGAEVFFEPLGIFIAILLATGLAFYFELKANKAFNLLNQVNDDEPVKVIREGNVVEVPKRDVVVGDVVVLATGDEVPADGLLLDATALQMDESSLTGEPLCAKTTDESRMDDEATYPSNMVLRGTKVMEGHALFEVTQVGDATENGKVFKEAQIDSSVRTPLNEQLDGLSDLITRLSYALATLIIVGRLAHYFDWHPLACGLVVPTGLFFYLVVHKFENWSRWVCILTIAGFAALLFGSILGLHEWLNPGAPTTSLLHHVLATLMIAVTLIVVAVPEGLPMAVTLSLAYSMRSMLRTNNLVRKMHACETMGATTVICTDKTGTLTQNKMTVFAAHCFDLPTGQLDQSAESHAIAEGIAVNSTASLDLTKAEPTAIGNPTEGALLLWLHGQGIDYRALKANTQTLAEIPFSTERKYMATLVRDAQGRRVLYIKGAPEIVMGLCANVAGGQSRADIEAQLLAYQQKAMRTLGLACQVLNDDETGIDGNLLAATRLTLLGIVAISDPVRDDVPAAIAECREAGIDVKIVTGDTPGTAMEIGRQIGLWTPQDTARNLITGPEFAELTDQQLLERVGDFKIIARARPMDKKRLVEALQTNNAVVAVTGDGTNDAPALKTAHVGLSMGDGTSVAKEASDITIIDNSFSSIGRAVMWGRSLYQNIQRFLLFQLTVNVSACLIVLVGAFLGTESPLTVTQMLWINLIMDTFGAMALASLPPSTRVMNQPPRDRNAFILNRSMYANILGVGTAFFLMLLALVLIFQHAEVNCMRDLLHFTWGSANAVTPYEQTLIFSIFVWTHFWYMFNARAYATGRSIFRTRMSRGFWFITLVIFLGQIAIVELLAPFFNVTSMFNHPSGVEDFVLIVVLSSVVLWVREIALLVAPRK